MPKRFEGEERAFYEWIVSGEVNVIPDERSLDRGQPDDKSDRSEEEITRPLLAAKGGQTRVEVRTSHELVGIWSMSRVRREKLHR